MKLKKITSLILSILVIPAGLSAGAMMPPPQKRIRQAEASEAPATSVDIQIYNIACRARELLVRFVTDPDLPVISNQKVFETSNGVFCTMGNPNSPVIPTEKQIENIQDIYEVVKDYYSTAPIEFRQKVAEFKTLWFDILKHFHDISSEASRIIAPRNSHPNDIYAHLTDLFLYETFKDFLPSETREITHTYPHGTTASHADTLHGYKCLYCYDRPFGTFSFGYIFHTLLNTPCSDESFLTALIKLHHHYKIKASI